MGISMKVNGKTTIGMVKVLLLTKKVDHIMENGVMG